MKLGPFLGYMAALICLTWSIWLVIAGIINYDPQSEIPRTLLFIVAGFAAVIGLFAFLAARGAFRE